MKQLKTQIQWLPHIPVGICGGQTKTTDCQLFRYDIMDSQSADGGLNTTEFFFVFFTKCAICL